MLKHKLKVMDNQELLNYLQANYSGRTPKPKKPKPRPYKLFAFIGIITILLASCSQPTHNGQPVSCDTVSAIVLPVDSVAKDSTK